MQFLRSPVPAHLPNILSLTLFGRSALGILSGLPKPRLSDDCPSGRELSHFSKRMFLDGSAKAWSLLDESREDHQCDANAAGI